MNFAAADFPERVWDGTSHNDSDLDVDKNPDFIWKDKITQEVIAMQEWLVGQIATTPFQEAAFEGDVITNYGELASAAEYSKSVVLGLADEAALAGTVGRVKYRGVKELNNWFRITGSLQLEPQKVYYLSDDPGKLTTTIPTTGWLVKVGFSLTETQLFINPLQGIKL